MKQKRKREKVAMRKERGRCVRMGVSLWICVSVVLVLGIVEAKDNYPFRRIDILVPFAEESSAAKGVQILQDFLGKDTPKGFRLNYKPGNDREDLWRDIDSMVDDGYVLAQFRVPELYLLALRGQAEYKVKLKHLVMLYQCEISVLFVRETSAIKDVGRLMSLLSRRGDKVEIAGEGTGTQSHVTHIDFLEKSGLKVVYRPFEKASQAREALREEEVIAYWGLMGEVLGAEAKEMEGLRALVTASNERHPLLVGLETWKEKGIELESRSCFGLMLPETADEEMAKWLSVRARKVSKDSDYRNAVYKVGLEPFFVGWRDVKSRVRKEERRAKKFFERYGFIK